MPVILLDDGKTQIMMPDVPGPQDLADLQAANELAMSRNPYEGGGPMPKLPFSDPRIETLPEMGRVAAKTAYDATLGQATGLNRMISAGLEKGVGLVSPSTENKMREAREFDAKDNPHTKAGHAAEQFIQPRSSEGTRIANIGAMAAGGGLMGKMGRAFSPAMGAGSGFASGLASETYGAASNQKKWQGDPANDEQFGKLAFGLGAGVAAPYAAKGAQIALTSGPDRERLARLFQRGGLTPEAVEGTMRPGGILQKSEEVGIPLTTAQAIPIDNALDAAQGNARGNIAMALTRKKLAEQPKQSLDAVRDWTERSVVGGGQVRSPQELANQGRASANSHFDSISADAGAAKDLAMLQSGSTGAQVDPAVVEDFLAQARAYSNQKVNTRAGGVVDKVEEALTNPKWVEHEKKMRGVAPELPNDTLEGIAKAAGAPGPALPLDDPRVLAMAKASRVSTTPIPNPAYKANPHPQFLADENQVRGALDSALAGFGPNVVDTKQVGAELNKHAGYLRGLINDVIAPETPAVNAGKSAAELVLRRADADKQQLVGGMRGEPTGPAPLSSSPSEIFKDTSRAPATGQVGEITQLRNKLENGTAFGLQEAAATGRPNPDLNQSLFPDSARTHFNDVLNSAGARGGARSSDGIAAALVEKLGNFSRQRDKRADMTQEIIQNTAESQGPRAVAQAPIDKQELHNIMDVVGHTVERSGAGGIAPSEVGQAMSPDIIRKAAGLSLLTPLRTPFRKLADMHEAGSAKWLDSILNTDEGRKQLQELMRKPEGSIHKAALSDILRDLSTQPRKMDEAKAAWERKLQGLE